MKKIFALLTFLIIVGIFIPTVSASSTTITQLPFTDTARVQLFDYAEGTYGTRYEHTSGWGGLAFSLSQVQNHQNVHYMQCRVDKNLGTEGYHDVWYKRPSDNTYQRGVLQYIHYDGGTIITFWPTNWDVEAKTGAFSSSIYADNDGVPASEQLYNNQGDYHLTGNTHTAGNPAYGGYFGLNRYSSAFTTKYHLEGYTNSAYSIGVTDMMASLQIDLQREFPPDYHYSVITAYDSDDNVILTDSGSEDLTLLMGKNELAKIRVLLGNNEYIYNIALGSDIPVDPGTPTVTVYVRNSQTGAAIANSRVVIDALVDGEYHPVINRTESSGIFSMTLQATGGGPPNPDGYRLIASAEGYISVLPEINFTVDEYTTSIYCYLDPTKGGPEDENNTFIDFFVRDMSANPISGATINFGGYTMITNSAGYAVIEVAKNATYTYTVSKSGYGPLTGNVVIGDDPRHTINTVLAPAVTPTTQTPIPTDTAIGPTPTLTAPTGEPVSNWLEWFAAHFGMILGGGVEIGKIFMWLCFTVPVGVYVGKQAKAGAAGFMAGAGIVTLFFVLIGWVPIWLVVLLALIIGLLYAKVFNNTDNGGGR